MIALYVANLAVSVLLVWWPLWFSRRRLHFRILNPITVPMFIGIPVELMKLLVGPVILIDGGLWNAGFQYAVLMTNVFTVSQIAGTLFFYRLAGELHIENHLPYRGFVLTSRHLYCSGIFFFAIFALAFLTLASSHIGVIEWVKNPRVGYQLYRVGEGYWYAIAVNALSVSMILLLFAKPVPHSILPIATLFVAMSYLLGSKGIMLAIFTSTLIVLCFIGWRRLPRFLLLGAPIMALLLVWNLYLALSDRFELQSVVEYFDYYRNAADYYHAILNSKINLFHGQILLSSFWAYVPRGLVASKPFVYGILYVNEIFYPGQAELTNTPAFGGAVEQYADFGVLGVILFGFLSTQSILNGVLYHLLFRATAFNPRKLTLPALLIVLALFGPAFGQFFAGLLYWFLFALVALVIRILKPPEPPRVPLYG